MFLKVTSKFDSNKIFVEVATQKINYPEILGKFHTAKYKKIAKLIPVLINILATS